MVQLSMTVLLLSPRATDGPTDEHGRFLVTSEALIEAARR